jgi:hypothetical protein
MQLIVGFSRPKKKKILSSLIMAVEQTNYSHVYVKFYSKTYDRYLIYQASGTQVNFVGSCLFDNKNEVVQEFNISVDSSSFKEMITFCIDNAGVAYGVKQLAGIAIVKFGKFIGKNLSNPWRDNKQTYVCSELVGYILKDYANIHVDLKMDDLSPKDIHNILNKMHSDTATLVN